MKRSTLTKQQMKKAGIALAVLLVASYVLASILQWQQYKDTKAGFDHAKSAIAEALKPNKKAANQNRQALQLATDQLVNDKSVCNPEWWVAWQTVFPSLKSLVNDCKSTATKQAVLKAELGKVNNFLSDEHNVTAIMNQIPATYTVLTDKTWDSAIKTWSKVGSDLKKYKASKAYEPVVEALRSQVAKVLIAWDDIKTADKKQDKKAYETAYNHLDQNATDLVNAADISDKALKSLLDAADQAASKL